MDFIFDSSLVLYLPLCALDGASFISKDRHGHLCTVTGALWTPQGRYFDKLDDKITIPDNDVLDITTELTLEGWVNLYELNRNNSIMGKAATIFSQASYTLQIWNNNQFVFGTSTDGSSMSSLTISSSIPAVANRWYHLVGTFSRPTRVIYLHGVQRNTDSWDNDIFVGTSDLFIGKYAGTSNTTAGTIGEVRIYNRALTPLEILRNYLATKWRYQ